MIEGDNLVVIREMVSIVGDNLVVIREVVSIEGDNLVVFWSYKRGTTKLSLSMETTSLIRPKYY
jgi:hypothetical protein